MTLAKEDPVWSLGDRLAKARERAGLNQRGMAEKLGVSSAAVAKWEADRGEPRHFLETMERWSEITGVSVAWLVGSRPGLNAHNPGSAGHMTHMALLPALLGQMELALTKPPPTTHSHMSTAHSESGGKAA